MAKIAQNLSVNQINSLQGLIKKSAMSPMLQDWKWEPLIDSDLEEWLLINDVAVKEDEDSPLKFHESELLDSIPQDLSDLGVAESNYWLEEFPLFEEFQPLDEIDNQSNGESQSGITKSNQRKVSSGQNDVTSSDKFEQLPLSIQDLLSSSIENTTFVFSGDNVVYIRADSPVPGQSGKCETQEDLELDKFSTDTVFSPQDGNMSKSVEEEEKGKWEEMDAVEEILRNAAMELDQWESDTTRSEMSSATSPAGSSSAQEEEEEEEEEEGGEESDDPEWNPKRMKIVESQKTKPKMSSKTSSRMSRRTESQEDKRQRKKEQNKYAATRYRLKKKAEVSELLREEEELKEKRMKLKEKVGDIENEIRCLKGLMRDFFKAKGLF